MPASAPNSHSEDARTETSRDGEPFRERSTSIGVIVVQEHPLLASAIVEILECEPGISVCAVARTGADATLLAAKESIRVVLIDYSLPDMTGAQAAAIIRSSRPEAAIVFHTADDTDTAILDAIDAGAGAYLTRSASAEEIVEAVRRAARGEVLIPAALFAKAIARDRRLAAERGQHDKVLAEFTPRELDVLRLLAEGHDIAGIARRLVIAPHTVEWHVRHVIEKLNVHSMLQAVIAAVRLGIVEL